MEEHYRRSEAYWDERRECWHCKVSADGFRKSFYSSKKTGSARKGKLEAERKADEWLRTHVTTSKSYVKDVAPMFLDSIRLRSEQLYISYEKQMRLYILPVIGVRKVQALTEVDLQRVIDVAYRNRGLSKRSLQNISACLTAFLKFCRKSRLTDLILEDPLIIPKGAVASHKTILDEEALRILFTDDTTVYYTRHQVEFRKTDPYIWRYRFAVVYGFRPSELSGLKWSDIKNDIIYIRRGYNVHQEFTEGKNDNARRTALVTPTGKWILDSQKELCRAFGIESEYIFPNMKTGAVCTQKVVYRAYKRYCAVHGITEGTTPYELRHTFCSINDEMPDYLKQQVMGHSKSMNTNQVYGHKKASDLKKAADFMEDTIRNYRKLSST